MAFVTNATLPGKGLIPILKVGEDTCVLVGKGMWFGFRVNSPRRRKRSPVEKFNMLEALRDTPDAMVRAGDLYNILQYILQYTEDMLDNRCPEERDPMED